ncbi:MAG: hypothetical protein RJA70_1220, partial [Pseudomonadota bacterium]
MTFLLGSYRVNPVSNACLWLAFGLVLACTNNGHVVGDVQDAGLGGPGSSGGGPGSGGGGPGSGGGGPGSGGQSTCPLPLPASPLHRLTSFEYDNTIRELLGVTGQPSRFLRDTPAAPFTGREAKDKPTLLGVRSYRNAARQIAESAIPNDGAAAKLAGCAELIEDCGNKFIRSFGERALRRPVRTEEAAGLLKLFTMGSSTRGLTGGVRLVVESVLQYPQFLYRIEAAPPTDQTTVTPTSWEMASRLSYLIWGSMGDAPLFEAARSDNLKAPEDIAAQAQRMLDDDRARAQIADFHAHRYHYAGVETMDRDPKSYPAWQPAISQYFREESDLFTTQVVLDRNATFSDLWTAKFTSINDPLAALYGLPAPGGGPELRRISTDGIERGGLFTQGAFLMATTPGDRTYPKRRGYRVLTDVFCEDIDVPNDTQHANLGLTSGGAPGVAMDDANPDCQKCHQRLNQLGQGFEHYDGLGRWRTEVDGSAVDASGELPTGSADVHGAFSGVIALQSMISTSQAASDCYARSWAAFAYGYDAY